MNLPYIVGPPIQKATDFYGRSTEIARVYEILAGQQVQSLSVLGLARVGKTSFLKQVARPEVKAAYLVQPERYIFILLDVALCKSAELFYQKLFLELVSILRINISKPLHIPSSSSISLYDIEDLLLQISGYRVVLLLDNFDSILDGEYDLEFMTELRALVGAWEYELACITASYLDLYTLGVAMGLPPTSPFYNIFYPSPIFLAGLDVQACDQLICEPLRGSEYSCSNGVVAEICETAGTIPICMQSTAVRWWRQPGLERPLLVNVFTRWWDAFTYLEKTLLLKIAMKQSLTAGKVDISTRETLQRLLDYGVIVESAMELRLNGNLWANWIQEQSHTFEIVDPAVQFFSNK
ncbi:MAG: ATP-binding protein [Anaerolineales bacterium]|nr:ATP-binding protein [Anaerolineales bacterium]